MDTLLQIIAVIGLAILEMWLAVPAGFVFGLNPVVIGIASAAGTIIGVVLAFLMVEKLIQWAAYRLSIDIVGSIQRRRLYRIWEKYGVIGLGLLAPLFTGAPLGVAIGLISGIPKRSLFWWIALGVVLWAIILTVAIALGIITIKSLVD